MKNTGNFKTQPGEKARRNLNNILFFSQNAPPGTMKQKQSECV